MAAPGRTRGRPNSAVGVKWFFKPSLNRLVGRMPGVVRKSAKVLAVNKQLEARADSVEHPAVKCHGKTWDKFVACLRKEMRNLMAANKATIEADARMIAEEYNIPVSTKEEPVYRRLGMG